MPRTGATYNLPTNLNYPAQDGEVIEPVDHNEVLEDLAQAVTDSVSRDGAGNMSGDLNMGSNKLTNLAAGSAPGHSVRYEQVQLASAVATAWEGLGWAPGKMGYATGATAFSLIDTQAFGRSLLNTVDAPAAKTLLALIKADVGLGNVDNTSDANKPVSTAQATAISGRVAKTGDTMSGTLTVNAFIQSTNGGGKAELRNGGDIQTYRVGGTTGYHFFNAAETRYLGYDGSRYGFVGAPLDVNGSEVATLGASQTFTAKKYFTGSTGTCPQFDDNNSAALMITNNANAKARYVRFTAGASVEHVNNAYSQVIFSFEDGGVFNASNGLRMSGKAALSHAGSYTSGQVTMSTSAPSGGSDGDVWFQYS